MSAATERLLMSAFDERERFRARELLNGREDHKESEQERGERLRHVLDRIDADLRMVRDILGVSGEDSGYADDGGLISH